MTRSFLNPLARTPKSGYPEAISRLKAETRALLALPDYVAVSVTELACHDPACPGVETVVAVIGGGKRPRLARIHKAIPEVTTADLTLALHRLQ
jgi:hypothetical protein